MEAELPSPVVSPPRILFRVECHDRESPAYNSTLDGMPEIPDMVARDPMRPVTRKAFDDCLSWRRVNTPFIPLTGSWTQALRRRRKLIEKGESDVVIIAVWSQGLLSVYNAYDIANWLGYLQRSLDKRRRLGHHLSEYLVYGRISCDEYRILAIFEGTSDQTDINLNVAGLDFNLQGRTTIPGSFMTDAPGETADEKLEHEIYLRTGNRGDSTQLLCLKAAMIETWGHSDFTPDVCTEAPCL